MSRSREGQLFIGRLSRNTRTRDLEEVFETYGRLSRCDIKYGSEYDFFSSAMLNYACEAGNGYTASLRRRRREGE